MIIGILSWIVFGLVVGLVARLLIPGRQAIGVTKTILLGIAGSFIGGFVVFLLRGGEALQATSFIGSLLGAVALLWFATRKSRGTLN